MLGDGGVVQALFLKGATQVRAGLGEVGFEPDGLLVLCDGGIVLTLLVKGVHPATAAPRVPYVTQTLADEPWPVVAASDYMKAVADQLARFVPGGLYPLGTDGFGRSDTREELRRHFEVDAASICVAALAQLARRGAVPASDVERAITELGIDPEKVDAARA